MWHDIVYKQVINWACSHVIQVSLCSVVMSVVYFIPIGMLISALKNQFAKRTNALLMQARQF